MGLLLLSLSVSSCNQQTEICTCFETRLAIKNMLKKADNPKVIIKTNEYKMLERKKKKCLMTIEPAYFEKKGSKRNGRSDRAFLLEELGECDAVKELLGVHEYNLNGIPL